MTVHSSNDGLVPSHFQPEAFKFLRGLARNNDRDWFEARRPIYERALRAPMLALIEEINVGLESFAPEHVRPPNKIMMRIYRDTRFSKDKLPYKQHLAAWWGRRSLHKTSGAGFYLQVSPQQVMVAAGVFMPEREQLLALREWMATHHAEYRTTLQRVLKEGSRSRSKSAKAQADGLPQGSDFTATDPEGLKRMPRGFAADHPAGELLRAQNWGVHLSLPAESALEPQLQAAVVRRFRQAAPLVQQLNAAILGGLKAAAPTAHARDDSYL